MAVISHTNQKAQSSKKSGESAAALCRYSSIRSPHSGISSLPFPQSRSQRQVANNFGDDADQFLLCRRDSTGNKLVIKHRFSRSFPSDCREAVIRRRATLPNKVQSNIRPEVLTYYPLHQGPRITVSSGDGTTLYADGESDSQRNAAAQSLYRALQQKQTSNKQNTLDDHLDMILGAVDVDVSIKETNSMQKVEISENDCEVQSEWGIIENGERIKRRGWTRNVGRKWSAWTAKMSGFLR